VNAVDINEVNWALLGLLNKKIPVDCLNDDGTSTWHHLVTQLQVSQQTGITQCDQRTSYSRQFVVHNTAIPSNAM
jgi:hypothetical protein